MFCEEVPNTLIRFFCTHVPSVGTAPLLAITSRRAVAQPENYVVVKCVVSWRVRSPSSALLRRVGMRTAQEVAQKDEGQAAYREQGHACPDVEQKAGRAGINQSIQ